jgi:hypothetical protein
VIAKAARPDHPVVDKTSLTGSYDLTVKWSGRGQLGAGGLEHPAISLFNSIEKDLGIKVESQTRQSESVVIESMNEVPSPNPPPGTAAKLPPPVTESEVAEIRPSRPDTKQSFNMKSGRLELFGITMRDLIGFDIVWSPPGRVYGRGGAPATPNGGLTIFEAIDKQLGLKLSVEKHPMTIVVIDHVDRTPSEN